MILLVIGALAAPELRRAGSTPELPRVRRAGSTRASQRSPLGAGAPLPSSVNCTYTYLRQPLDHFARGSATTYQQRICLYDGFVTSPQYVLFYVGNESPVEEYVNNTGLMWEVGAEIGALLVFAEHRYEGLSVPNVTGMPNCLSYCTIEQALADYASAISWLKDTYTQDLKVVVLGGSYGGMLAGWFRMKYPASAVGAIAASAPIWGLPTLDSAMDGSSLAVSRNFGSFAGAADACRDNMLGAWPLMTAIGELDGGPEYLAETMGLCSAPRSGAALASAVQGMLFDLAEANYPFPSTYITSAVGPGGYALPAWPIRVACADLTDPIVTLTGDVANVTFAAHIDSLSVAVDWDQIQSVSFDAVDDLTPNVATLLKGVATAWGLWCNVSGTLECLEPSGCASGRRRLEETSDVCTAESYSGGSWGPLCCNDDIQLVNTLVQGAGDGLFWPPNVPRGETLEDVLGPYGSVDAGCGSYGGLQGYPPTSDPWSRWLVSEFGDKSAVQAASNIVFSNGCLDPWSAAGVYDAAICTTNGTVVTNLTDSVTSLILDLGAHHLDLFFMHDDDPDCAIQARAFETNAIKTWLGIPAVQQPDRREF